MMMPKSENPRTFSLKQFNKAYQDVIIGNSFFEEPDYYRREKARYRRTIEYITSLDLPRPAKILEIGGGQIALLMTRMFDDRCTVGDVSDKYSNAVTRFGINFICCDLLHDDLASTNEYDLIVLCEVMEHFPIPPHIILSKIRKWIRLGGFLLLTTPNLYRLRNVIRLALGMPVFCNFFYPQRGSSIGHPLEYSSEHLEWQIETAGYKVKFLAQVQLSNAGASVRARIGRTLLTPALALIPRWRDSLICAAANIEKRPTN